MIEVQVRISKPVNEDATVIQVIGYVKREDGVTEAYQGFPDALSTIDELSGSFHEDGWLWQPIDPGNQLEPSIKFPGIWRGNFDNALRDYSGIDASKISIMSSTMRALDVEFKELQNWTAELQNRIEGADNKATEALDLAKRVSAAWQTGQERPTDT